MVPSGRATFPKQGRGGARRQEAISQTRRDIYAASSVCSRTYVQAVETCMEGTRTHGSMLAAGRRAGATLPASPSLPPSRRPAPPRLAANVISHRKGRKPPLASAGAHQVSCRPMCTLPRSPTASSSPASRRRLAPRSVEVIPGRALHSQRQPLERDAAPRPTSSHAARGSALPLPAHAAPPVAAPV